MAKHGGDWVHFFGGGPAGGHAHAGYPGSLGGDAAAGQPSTSELLAELERVHACWKAALPGVDTSVLDAEHPDVKMRGYFPTVGAMVAFIMTSHEMDHLGQVAAWRRAAGLGPAK